MSNDNDFTTDLTQFDEEYKQVEAAEKENFDPVPNGKYQAVIDKAYMAKSKNSGDPMFTWELVIISGQFKNRRLFRNNMIVTKENLSWLKTDLETVGIVLEKVSDLPSRLNEFLDIVVEVSVKNRKEGNKDYQNVYLNKKLDIDLPENYQKGQENATENVDLAF